MEEIETLKTMLGKIAEEEKKTITENRKRKVSYCISIIIIEFFTVFSSLFTFKFFCVYCVVDTYVVV